MIAFLSFTSFPYFYEAKAQRYKRLCAKSVTPLVIGINQYSHDASVALIDANSGKLLFAQSKERLTRRKHDGGDVSELVRHAIESIKTDNERALDVASEVRLVVANNHHFRILPFESRIPFQVSLGYLPSSYQSPWNLIGSPASFLKGNEKYAPRATKIELSHHLAHASSAVYSCPFTRGVVVVMDGMGDARDDWLVAQTCSDSSHISELSCSDFVRNDPGFREYPEDVDSRPGVSFREAETAYVFEKSQRGVQFSRIFKRWTPENAPPELSNHSFEEMDSIGAMYSRVSAIIFKDWNNCGKVMGLAPYGQNQANPSDKKRYFMNGHLYDGSIDVEPGKRKGLEHLGKDISNCDDNTPSGRELRLHFQRIAYHVQRDLEEVVADFISRLMSDTGERNLVLAGGVALNSSMNGMLSSHPCVEGFYVPPFPGDEGIAIGCANFGHSLISRLRGQVMRYHPKSILPYLGRKYSQQDIWHAIEYYSPWIQKKRGESAKEAAVALAQGKVVAWFSGRGEFGPRALGSRSLLADPRDKAMVTHLNKLVKKRESFRPFAPSILAEYASEWFGNCSSESSPFMSLTRPAKMPNLIPAVVHVDGTSRLQTVIQEQNPEFYALINHFFEITNIPMVLNTSFNTSKEPIVESPIDAINTFLKTDGIDHLIFPGHILSKRDEFSFSLNCALSSSCSGFRSRQIQNVRGESLQTTIAVYGRTFQSDGKTFNDLPDEQEVELLDGQQLEILEIVHELGVCTISDVLREIGHSNPEQSGTSSGFDDEHAVSEIMFRVQDLFKKQLVHCEL
ncbi:unnamed protein product [Agarophyton chilense]